MLVVTPFPFETTPEPAAQPSTDGPGRAPAQRRAVCIDVNVLNDQWGATGSPRLDGFFFAFDSTSTSPVASGRLSCAPGPVSIAARKARAASLSAYNNLSV